MGPHETISLLKLQVHNYTIGPTNWDHNEVSVVNSLRGDAITRIVYRRTDEQPDNRVSNKLDWSRPVELKQFFKNLFDEYNLILLHYKLNADFSPINNIYGVYVYNDLNDRKCQNASKCLLRNGTESNNTFPYILLDYSNAFGLSRRNFLSRTSLLEPFLCLEGEG